MRTSQACADKAVDRGLRPVSRFDIDPAQQKPGAAWVGGWPCGPNPETTTMRAYITDRKGARSDALDYTVACRGSAACRRRRAASRRRACACGRCLGGASMSASLSVRPG